MTSNGRDIHTIFLDVGGTLLRAEPSVGAVYAEVAARHGIEVDSSEVERNVRRIFWEKLERRRKYAMTSPQSGTLDAAKDFWREVVRSGLGEAADHPGFETYFDDVFEEFAHARRYRFFDETQEVLERLRTAGYRLGIISNWDTRLRQVLEELNVTGLFETIVISGEVGCEKPSGEIYDIARRKAGATGGERLMQVGDNRQDDYEGALAAGFEARHLNRPAGDTLLTVFEDLV